MSTRARRTWLSPVCGPVERGFYTLAGVDPQRGMGWKEYAFALILLNALHFALLYAILRLQYYLPWNPQGITAMSPQLAFKHGCQFCY
ncbi:MAG: potassium-transporting ATPase subunit KdpA [Rhodospirillales bacterium]